MGGSRGEGAGPSPNTGHQEKGCGQQGQVSKVRSENVRGLSEKARIRVRVGKPAPLHSEVAASGLR